METCKGAWKWVGGKWELSLNICDADAKEVVEKNGICSTGLYCGKHENIGKKYEEYDVSQKYCTGFPKRCGAVLAADYKNKTCEACLGKGRLYEKSKNKRRRDEHDAHLEQVIEDANPMIPCGDCGKSYPLDSYRITKMGQHCRKCPLCDKKDPRRNRDRSDGKSKTQKSNITKEFGDVEDIIDAHTNETVCQYQNAQVLATHTVGLFNDERLKIRRQLEYEFSNDEFDYTTLSKMIEMKVASEEQILRMDQLNKILKNREDLALKEKLEKEKDELIRERLDQNENAKKKKRPRTEDEKKKNRENQARHQAKLKPSVRKEINRKKKQAQRDREKMQQQKPKEDK